MSRLKVDETGLLVNLVEDLFPTEVSMKYEGNGTQGDERRNIERALILNPDDFDLNKRLANTCARTGDLQATEQAYRNASGLSPDPAQYREIVTEAQARGFGWLGQPLPNFAKYVIRPVSQHYAREVDSVQGDEAAVYQPIATIIDPKTKKARTTKRLFTFEENIKARVEDFETLTDEQGNPRTIEQRLALFRKWLSSCTSVAYKARSTKFKIGSTSPQLIDIPEEFNQRWIELAEGEYESMDGIKLNRNKGIYSSGQNYRPLTSVEQVINHEGWNAVVPDTKLLKAHAEIYFAQIESGMGFRVIENPKQNQLRTLVLYSLGYGSDAVADWDLDNYAQSLRVAQK